MSLVKFFSLSLQISFVLGTTCPAGGVYDSTFQRCYVYYNEPAVFLAAESTCRSIGGNLVEIRNGFENTFVAGKFYGLVTTLAASNPPSAFWIGANLLVAPKWTWTTNDTASYTNWAADQPTDPSSFDCATVATANTNLWRKELCYSARPFVCNAPPSSNDESSPCDPGYTQYENRCYKKFKGFIKGMNFYDSSIFCQFQENANLPKIPSSGVQDFLHSFIYDEKSNIWLGCTCTNTNSGSCLWWDLTPLTYTYFASSNPGGAWPVAMRGDTGQWYTEYDFRPSMTVVVCEKPARST